MRCAYLPIESCYSKTNTFIKISLKVCKILPNIEYHILMGDWGEHKKVLYQVFTFAALYPRCLIPRGPWVDFCHSPLDIQRFSFISLPQSKCAAFFITTMPSLLIFACIHPFETLGTADTHIGGNHAFFVYMFRQCPPKNVKWFLLIGLCAF